MLIFVTDLDNTMIYSYKHDIGPDKINVEIYDNREVSFMTETSFDLLKKISKKIMVVPLTTRTEEQFRRITLPFMPKYSLVCNGGILLANGKSDEQWYNCSLEITEESYSELIKAAEILKSDININFEIRNIKNLFIFTKTSAPEATTRNLIEKLDTTLVDVMTNGVKIYILPKNLTKGTALKRFREKIKADKVISAGDSIFDVSMLTESDVSIAPKCLTDKIAPSNKIIYAKGKKIFSEEILEYILNSEM